MDVILSYSLGDIMKFWNIFFVFILIFLFSHCDQDEGSDANEDARVDVDPCNDNNLCTKDMNTDDGCTNTPINCNDNDLCTTESCGPEWGCMYTFTYSIPCDDGNLCTSNDWCGNEIDDSFYKKCMGVVPTDCDDNDPSTDDYCDPTSGCKHE